MAENLPKTTLIHETKVTTVTGIPSEIVASDEQTVLADTDIFPIVETTTLKHTLWSTIKSTLKTYLDGLYLLLDQTTPQTIENGVPLMTTPVDEYGSGDQLVNMDYVRSGVWLLPPMIDWYDPVAEGGLPVDPEVGDRYGCDATGSGWTIDYIYEWDGSEWIETAPEDGWMIWDLFGLIMWIFFSGGWMEMGGYSFVPYEGAIYDIDLGAQNLTTSGSITSTVGGIVFPTADPEIAGAWWDNAGTLTKSAG